MKKLIILVALLALAALPVVAGEWHSGTTNLCTDCHTMHFSQSHNWDGTTPVPTTAGPNGNWLGASGPNAFLLKAPGNTLCLSCHDGQTFAPDVLGGNTNASPAGGRAAGALNEAALGGGYDVYKGHTLDSTTVPPGYAPAAVGLVSSYNAATGLECISCHAQHGPTTAYRNLGPYSMGYAGGTVPRPTYWMGSANDATKDVWVNIAFDSNTGNSSTGGTLYSVNSGAAATFNPYYDAASVSYNRNDTTAGTTKSSNKMDTFCGACHGDFHGGPEDVNIGATVAALDGFIRHPTSQVVLGAAGAQGYGGHSSLPRFVANTTKVKVYSDQAGYADATPGCVSCHKAHGNQNPFGLIFLAGNATVPNDNWEGGGWTATQTQNQMQGYRNLCGQCHGQGN